MDSFSEVMCGGLLFEHSRGDELKTEARQKACADISRQKAAYEKALGVRLRVKLITEDPVIVLRAWRSHASPAASRLAKSQTSALGEQVFPDYDTDMSLFQTLTYRARVIVEYYVETAGH